MPGLLKKHLSLRFILLILTFLLIFSFILDRQYYRLYSHTIEKGIYQNGRIISDLVANINLEEIMSRDYVTLNSFLVTLMNLSPKIIDIRIYDRDYTLVSAPVAKLDLKQHKYIQKLSHAITIGKKYLGHIEIWIDFSAEMADLTRFRLFSSLFLAIFVFIIALGFFIVYNFLIKKPLNELGSFLNRVTSGVRAERLPAGNTMDEIGRLRTGFNQMSYSLLKREDEILTANRELTQKNQLLDELNKKIQTTKDSLEYEVKKRTAALEETNIMLRKERDAILNILEDLERVNRELKLAQAHLVQSAKMAAVGQLAGGVAHEINNPLTGVLNNVQLIKMELVQNKGCLPSDFNDLLDVVEESAQRCSRIVRTLLDFSRAGKGPHQPLNINEALDKAQIIADTEMRIGNIKPTKEYSLNLPEIMGDSNQLQQVFLDIFNNARWALRDTKGPEIRIKTSSSSDGKFVVVEISDNGCGIEKENLPYIFEPFFTTKKPGEGTGLGLSICYGIIKEHAGSIEAESEGKDKGATFRISLPIVKS